MSRIIFVPVCEKCGHEFEEMEFTINTHIICPKCGEILGDITIPNYEAMVHQDGPGNYVAEYSKKVYY